MLKKCEPSELFEELEHMTQKYTIRAYECEECKSIWSEIVPRRDNHKIKCPDCQRHSLEPIIYDIPCAFVEQDPVTLAQQAERNMKKWGKDETEERQAKHAEKGEKGREKLGIPGKRPETWYGKPPEGAGNFTAEQQKKYIETGQTP